MTKIILKEVSEGYCSWFCDSCKERIVGVPENLFSRPLIDKCPHCNSIFSDYELCKSRIDMQNKIFAEFGIVNPDKK